MRRNWESIKDKLLARLNDGSYEFDILDRLEFDDATISLWSSQDMIALKLITNTLDSWKKRSEKEDSFSKEFAIAIDEIHYLWTVEMSHSKELKDKAGFSLSSQTRLGFIHEALKPLVQENLIIALEEENRIIPKYELYERLENLYHGGDRYEEIQELIKYKKEDEDAKTI